MNKNKLLTLISLASVFAIASTVIAVNSGLGNAKVNALTRNGGPSSYAIEFTPTKNKLFNETDSSRHAGVTACQTNLGNDIYIAYADSFYSEGNFISLGTQYGAFCNYSPDEDASKWAYPTLCPIHGMTSITFTFPDNVSQKRFNIAYGNTLMNRLYDRGSSWDESSTPRFWFNQPEVGKYTGIEEVNITSNSYTFDFNDSAPSHFYVENWGANRLDITSVIIEYTCSSENYNYYLQVMSDDENMGTVSNVTGIHASGTSITVTATPEAGYRLQGWYHDDVLVSQDNPYTFNMPSNNYFLTAKFYDYLPVWNANHGVTPVYDEENNKVTYGLMPQTRISDDDLIATLNSLDDSYKGVNNWYLYDEEYYAKRGSTWYLCERLSWLVLSHDENTGEFLLLSEKLLGTASYGETTDYYQSNVRNWLIGNFYNSVFTLNNTCLLDVDGEDKVTILEYNDFRRTDYGFTSGYGSDAKRRSSFTDYSNGYVANSFYWTKTPCPDNLSSLVCRIDYGNGSMSTSGAYKKDTHAIRPTIKIQIA